MQKFVYMSVAAVIMLGMAFSSHAQKRITFDKVPMPITHTLQGTYEVSVKGTESSVGAVDQISNQMYGWGFYAKTETALGGHLFLNLNYSTDLAPGVEINPFTSPGNAITGGSWTQVIYVDGVYEGTVSGTITAGTFSWDGRVAQVEFQLLGEKGTGSYVGLTCTGSFRGTVDRSSGETIISGSLMLNY